MMMAQTNLVPNASFESNSSCPASFTSAFSSVNTWINCGNTPDYFNPCSSTFGVPSNYFGVQLAYADSAYAGIGVYSPSINDFREYIGVQLTQPLVAGQSYNLSFFVSLYDNCQFATNYLGGLVSPLPNLNQNNFLIAAPQVEASNIISDKNNWIQISGNFIAQGGEEYLYLGCFKGDSQLNIVSAGSGSLASIAYYIDDVSLTINSGLGVETNSQPFINFFPNPAESFLNINSSQPISELQIYNSAGELVLQLSNPLKENIVSTVDFPEGLYLCTYTNVYGHFSTKFIILD